MTKNEALDIAIADLSAWVDDQEDRGMTEKTEYLKEAIKILEELKDD